MKRDMPEIPWEADLVVCVNGLEVAGCGVQFLAQYPYGRAALAGYCMAVIDVLIGDIGTITAGLVCPDTWLFYEHYKTFLCAWKIEWAVYGGYQ